MRFFSNDEVDANYEAVFGVDKKITIQGVYGGMLSNITPVVAEKLIAMQDNQIKRKPGIVASIETTTENKGCGCQ